MEIVQQKFNVSTSKRNQMVDITSQVRQAVREAGIVNGSASVHVPHTTAAVTINENADPDVMHDILLTLEELLPQFRKGYRHNEQNSDSHVKSSLVGCSEQILVKDGELVLGVWQGIYFCEFDGPRSRRFFVQVQGK